MDKNGRQTQKASTRDNNRIRSAESQEDFGDEIEDMNRRITVGFYFKVAQSKNMML